MPADQESRDESAELTQIIADGHITTAEYRADPAAILERVAVMGDTLAIVSGGGDGPIVAVMVPIDDVKHRCYRVRRRRPAEEDPSFPPA